MSQPDSAVANAPESVECALRAIYNWNYEPEIDELRALYANAVERQWIGVRDLDWETEIDLDHAVANLEDPQQFPFGSLDMWNDQTREKQRAIAAKMNAWMLSQFLHGEQGALMVAAQLVNAVPHMDAKFYASTQAMDEARHVEVFARYIAKLDRVYDIDPTLRDLLDITLATDDWPMKFVAMQIVLEGLALAAFRNMRRTTNEPLLAELLRLVSHDEARHTAYGIKYLRRILPTLGEDKRQQLEDFAFEATRKMIDLRSGTGGFGRQIFNLFASEGIDVGAAMREIMEKREQLKEVLVAARRKSGFDADPVRGFILPTLQKIGLYSARIQPSYKELIEANLISGFEGTSFDGSLELPDDLEKWVDETSAYQ